MTKTMLALIFAGCLGLVPKSHALGAGDCGISFNGPAGDVLTSYVDVYPNYPNSSATFNVVVQTANQPLALGTYLGWCVDANVELDPTANGTVAGTVYTGTLLATCDTNLNSELPPGHTTTAYVSPAVWNQVNYILNHKISTNFWAVQVAINRLVGGPAQPSPPYPPYNPADVTAILTAVSNNAAAWVPQPGNVIGAVYAISQQAGITLTNPVQFILIEVPYCPITFTKCPSTVSLGCNPATIPDLNTNAANIVAVSSCGYPVTITGVKSQAGVGCSYYRYLNYTATDSYGNSATCSQTITWTVDTNAPVIVSVPTSASLGYNPATIPSDSSVLAAVNYAETCSAPTIQVSHVDSGSPCAYTRIFAISASDACGNKSVTNYVTYTWAIDTNAPVITSVPPSTNLGCSFITLPTDSTIASSITATDNCTLASTNVTHVDSTNSTTVTRTFTVTVKDAAGNTSAPINVVYTYTIAAGPVIVCAPDISITGTNASPSITGVPTLTDACGNPIICSNSATYTTNYSNLYCDQFSGAFCTLNGRVPDVAAMGGFKWTSSTSWLSCGNQAAITNCNASAYLPFQPTPGYLYQVSADMECYGDNAGDWLSLGFGNSGSITSGSLGNGLGWLLARNTGNTTYSDMWIVGAASGWTGFYPTSLTHYSVILDTRPSNPAAWTCTFLANGKVIIPATAFGGTGPSINIVGFGMNHTSSSGYGHVKNFCVGFGVPTIVTNSAACANLAYTDKVVGSGCAGKVQIARTWSAWDNQGHTNTCTQNIYETIALPPVTFVSTTTSLGCAPSVLPTDATVAGLVIGYSGLASTNVSHVDTTNTCNVTRTFTVTVKDACGNVSAAATLVYNWVNATPSVRCSVTGPANGTCLSPSTYTCWVTNTGNAPFSSCIISACGQSFSCPALNPGQSCSIPFNYTFLTKDLGLFNCFASVTATAATTCSQVVTHSNSCFTTVCGVPACKVVCSGPSTGLCLSPATYTCCVTNIGTCPFTSCLLNACGQNFACPSLKPGEGCVISIPHTFQIGELGLFNCLASLSAICSNSTVPSCTGQATCPTTVVGQPSCKLVCSGPSSGLCLSPATYVCAVTNNGTCPFSACSVTACGQTLACPALQPGQGCILSIPHTFQVAELGLFNCLASLNANCVNSTVPTCSVQSACTTTVVGQPSCKVSVAGPSLCSWFTPATYTCTVQNNGTCPLTACNLTACGKTFACPALSPGQSCNVTCTQSFSLANIFAGFNCQAVANCTASHSTAPTCSGQGSFFTSVHN